MTWAVRCLTLLALAMAALQVHRVRSRLAARDADPAIVARLSDALHAIPLDLDGGRYTGSEHPLGARIADEAGADVYLSTEYLERGGTRFQLYVGGSIANDENFHAPSYCMPAAGWEVVEEDAVPFTAYPVRDAEPKMRHLRLQRGDSRMVVYYWFQAGDRFADNEWLVRYARLLDIFAGRPLRPTVILVLYAAVLSDMESTERSAQEFLHVIGPHLRRAISQ